MMKLIAIDIFYALPAHKVSDHISMAHYDIDGVLLLIYISPVKVLPKGSFNPGRILIEFLCNKML